MAGSFPNLTAGTVAKYPVIRSSGFLTGITKFCSDKEQRWVKRASLTSLVLTYERINPTDLATIFTFFNTQKGAFDKTWSITFDGISYSYMVFVHDDFSPVESSPGLWNLTLRARQVRKN